VWAIDVQFVATADSRRLKFLNVIDEHSRRCLVIHVTSRCKAKDVGAERGLPQPALEKFTKGFRKRFQLPADAPSIANRICQRRHRELHSAQQH
jgi:hypothetical protein